eukprot:gene13291-17806_t
MTKLRMQLPISPNKLHVVDKNLIPPRALEPKILSFNYFFTRKCNYNCGFCFHTAKSSHVHTLENAKRIIEMLGKSGSRKINFAGGEPFLPEYRDTLLGPLVEYAKVECGYESVSIISNSVFITEDWFKRYSKYLDILGVSCDASDENINKVIGRGGGDHLSHVKRAALLCDKYNVMFKMNTVVNAYNWDHDMSSLINELKPIRWKIFQVLKLIGENDGQDKSLRNVDRFLISNDKFNQFVTSHLSKVNQSQTLIKVENNDVMQSSYILVDEYGCLLDCSLGGKTPTKSILEVGVDEAWKELTSRGGIGFDNISFQLRDGGYVEQPQGWTKEIVPDQFQSFQK